MNYIDDPSDPTPLSEAAPKEVKQEQPPKLTTKPHPYPQPRRSSDTNGFVPESKAVPFPNHVAVNHTQPQQLQPLPPHLPTPLREELEAPLMIGVDAPPVMDDEETMIKKISHAVHALSGLNIPAPARQLVPNQNAFAKKGELARVNPNYID